MRVESCCQCADLLEDSCLLLLDGGASILQQFLSGVEFVELGLLF